jgi:hypothetical protein
MPEIEHDSKLVERVALVYEGNAMAHLKRAPGQYEVAAAPRSDWTQHYMLAASSFVIAASYWSLVATRKALTVYRAAADIYRELGHEYWVVLALAASNGNDFAPALSAIDEMLSPNPQTIAFAMVWNELHPTERRDLRAKHLFLRWRETGNYPIGRLGIPLDYYGQLAQGIHFARQEKNPDLFFFAAADYLRRAAEVIRTASHDRFHWLRLESTILPAEPEAVAITTAMSIVSHAMFRVPISQMPNLDMHARLLVDIGEEMRDAARRDKAASETGQQSSDSGDGDPEL